MSYPVPAELIARLCNIVVCFGCATMLGKLYVAEKTRYRHNLYWAIAFTAWGFQLIGRILYGFANPIVMVTGLVMVVFFILGATSIVGHSDVFLTIIAGVTASLAGGYFYFGPHSLWYLPSLVPMFLMLVTGVIMKRKFGGIANWFLVGWILVIFTNLLSPPWGNPVIADVTSSVAKLIFLQGMTKPRYAYILFLYSAHVAKPLVKTLREKSPIEKLVEGTAVTILTKGFGELLNELSVEEITRRTGKLFELRINIKLKSMEQVVPISIDIASGEVSIAQNVWEAMPEKDALKQLTGIRIRITISVHRELLLGS